LISTRQQPSRVGPAGAGPGAMLRTLVAPTASAPCGEIAMAQFESSSVPTLRAGPPWPGDRGAARVMTMAGEYDLATVAALSRRFSAAIARDDTDLVVDLSAVSFLDAATISVIIRATGFLRDHARSLRLRDPSPCAWRILEICELETLIEPDVSGLVETKRIGALEPWMSDRPAPAPVSAMPAGVGSACKRP
jgi:anti-anti-sigma factor